MKLSEAYSISEALIELGENGGSKVHYLYNNTTRDGTPVYSKAEGIGSENRKIAQAAIDYLKDRGKLKEISAKYDLKNIDMEINSKGVVINPDAGGAPIVISNISLKPYLK